MPLVLSQAFIRCPVDGSITFAELRGSDQIGGRSVQTIQKTDGGVLALAIEISREKMKRWLKTRDEKQLQRNRPELRKSKSAQALGM